LLSDNLSKTHIMLFLFLYSGTESSILYIVRSLVSLASLVLHGVKARLEVCSAPARRETRQVAARSGRPWQWICGGQRAARQIARTLGEGRQSHLAARVERRWRPARQGPVCSLDVVIEVRRRLTLSWIVARQSYSFLLVARQTTPCK
jgi:hypothetical protein